jgi:hypothetical protein
MIGGDKLFSKQKLKVLPFQIATLLSFAVALVSCSSHLVDNGRLAVAQSNGGLTTKQTEHLRGLTLKLRPENSGSCARITEGSKVVLVYVGDTDYHLIACLNAGLGQRNLVVRITSPGGDSDIAALAAIYIRLYGMSVEVDGICFSSCANYVAPAAKRLVVLPLSFLGLHGAPDEFTEEVAKKLEAEVRAMPNIPLERMESYVQGNLAMLHRTSENHKMVQRTLNVGTQWFRLNEIELPSEVFNAAGLLLVPSKSMTKKCLKGIESLQMWEARYDYEKAALKMIYPSEGVDYFIDLPATSECN